MEKLTQEEIADLAAHGLADPCFFLKEFLPEWFPGPIPWVHKGIIAIVLRKTDFLQGDPELQKIIQNFTYKTEPDDPLSPELPIFLLEEDGSITLRVSQYVLIVMPRGFSKTTLLNGLVIFEICYLLREFIFYISESGPHAENQLANVKRKFETSDRIKAVFGNVVPGRQEVQRWGADQIETLTGIHLAARGRHGQIRGQNLDAKRPDRMLLDDVEDKESVSTDEQRLKCRTWFYEEALPALAELKSDATCTALGTLLHQEALLQTLRRDPSWTSVVFGATDKQGEYLWPAKMDEAKYHAKKASFARAGNLAGFFREYDSRFTDESTKKFPSRYFKYDPVPDSEIIVKALALDPAISQKSKKSDFLAMACTGMTASGKIVVLGCEGWKGLSPRQQVDKWFEWYFAFGLNASHKFGIESNAYQVALIHLIQEEMFRKKAYHEITPLHHSTSKLARVEGVLQPRYAAGYIYHARRFPLLEQQLDDWPNDKLDCPDVLAMAVGLLDPFAPLAIPEDSDPSKDEYLPLERVLGGDWRNAP